MSLYSHLAQIQKKKNTTKHYLPDSLAWKLLKLSAMKTEEQKLYLLPSQRKQSCAPKDTFSETQSTKTRHLFSPGEEQQSCLSLGIDSALKVEPEHMAAL